MDVAKIKVHADQNLDEYHDVNRIEVSVAIHVAAQFRIIGEVVISIRRAIGTEREINSAQLNSNYSLAIRQLDALEIGPLSKVTDFHSTSRAAHAYLRLPFPRKAVAVDIRADSDDRNIKYHADGWPRWRQRRVSNDPVGWAYRKLVSVDLCILKQQTGELIRKNRAGQKRIEIDHNGIHGEADQPDAFNLRRRRTLGAKAEYPSVIAEPDSLLDSGS